jgi:hypothetical protein
MKNIIRTLLCTTLFLGATGSLLAQTALDEQIKSDINITRQMVNDKRNTALAFNMNFTQEEKEAFWPLYREYRGAIAEVNDKRVTVIVRYADNVDNMTEKLAQELLDESIDLDEEIIRVKQHYIRKFRNILPNTKVARLMQIENRMDAMVFIKISEAIPLVQ